MPKVKALKSFRGNEEEGYVRRGDDVDLTPARQRELARNGLVPPVAGEGEADDSAKPRRKPATRAKAAAASSSPGKDEPQDDLTGNNQVAKLRSIAKAEEIDVGTAKKAVDLRAAIRAGRQAKAA